MIISFFYFAHPKPLSLALLRTGNVSTLHPPDNIDNDSVVEPMVCLRRHIYYDALNSLRTAFPAYCVCIFCLIHLYAMYSIRKHEINHCFHFEKMNIKAAKLCKYHVFFVTSVWRFLIVQ